MLLYRVINFIDARFKSIKESNDIFHSILKRTIIELMHASKVLLKGKNCKFYFHKYTNIILNLYTVDGITIAYQIENMA
jgi:uncharacterized membrane protein